MEEKNYQSSGLNYKQFTGTKTVLACPMSHAVAENCLGRKITLQEKYSGEGYLVEYPDGYTSWSPKDVFDAAYKCSETFIDRMEIELSELDDKISKLKSFIVNNVRFYQMRCDVRELLTQQLDTMQKYSTILATRIAFAKEELSSQNLCCKSNN